MRSHFRYSPEVLRAFSKAAEKKGIPNVVLLESTILTHGLAYPRNLEMARRVSEVVRERGCIPATVGIVAGRVHVGLDDQQIRMLCDPKTKSLKVSRRDYPSVLGRDSLNGGTTVSGTLLAAAKIEEHLGARPPVFVTGGVGGVHRGGEASLDVSADLVELGRSRVPVVSAGVKSILDIGRTLEFLETQGVCVATFGPTRDFPAFFTERSGFQSPCNVPGVADAAALFLGHRSLDPGSGLLLAVPIPAENSADGREIEDAIQAALVLAEREGVAGRDVTPFVLSRVAELTGGKSVDANLALIENNAAVGADIVREMRSSSSGDPGSPVFSFNEKSSSKKGDRRDTSSSSSRRRPVVIGGSIFDIVTSVSEPEIHSDGRTHPGSVSFGLGGVGRNLADALACFDDDPVFISAVGDDEQGKIILDHNEKLDKSNVKIIPGRRSSVYNAFTDNSGGLVFGVGDMAIHAEVSAKVIRENREMILSPDTSMVVFDGNLAAESIDVILAMCHGSGKPTFFEPTDLTKATKAAASEFHSALTYASPNVNELFAMAGLGIPDQSMSQKEKIGQSVELCQDLLRRLQVVLVTLGEDGVLLARRGSHHEPLPLENDDEVKSPGGFVVSAVHYPVEPMDSSVVCVSGAGDCFAAAFISSALRGAEASQDEAVAAGIQASRYTLRHARSVPADLGRRHVAGEERGGGKVVLL